MVWERLLNMDGLVSVKELAARWGVTRDTARQRTLDAGFPQVIHLGPRLLRWRRPEGLIVLLHCRSGAAGNRQNFRWLASRRPVGAGRMADWSRCPKPRSCG